MSEPDLKLCPFCGARLVAIFVSKYGMHHPSTPLCNLSEFRILGSTGYDNGDVSEVEWAADDIVWWNTRAE